ncbi:D-sedoheptulose-7-phosphate isomerase [Sphaerisporangium aureirubrum]|uniref:SIS domain-containing protein n=1 Tax=Sphaerisporangium aureirubrum TaxID=1544736 RepID=A0ABW1NN58_9ACTN
MVTAERRGGGEGVRGLYPFLYPGPGGTDADAVAQAAASTREKVAEIADLRRRVAALHATRIVECARDMAGRFTAGGRLFTFGNGGSSTDAQQVATTFLNPREGRPLPALCLTCDVAVVTALSNDAGFEVVFARQIAALARPGDIALGLSTSGGSANMLGAFREARARGLLTVALAGYEGGQLAESSMDGVLDHLFIVPSSSVHRIQEAQTTVYHILWEATQHALRDSTPIGT